MTGTQHPEAIPFKDDTEAVPPLESVLCTEDLDSRPPRPPDYGTESRALIALVQALADSPRTILQTLAETILQTLRCDSAGVSLLTTHDGGKRFYWPAIAGAWKTHIGGGTPREFGPCGDVLDRNMPLLFRNFERRYTYFQSVTPPTEECLLVPFEVRGKALGTIWAVTHNDTRKFDAEDRRQLCSLGWFASAAYRAHAALDATAQLAAIVESSDDAIISKDLNGIIRSWNRGAERLFGYPADDAIGRPFTMIIPSDRLSEAPGVLARIGQGEHIGPHDTVRCHRDGSRLDISSTLSPIRDANNKILGASTIARDISQRKRAEEALREADRRKSEFLAMLAHELRNPLAPIGNALQVLRVAEGDKEVARSALQMIERQLGQLVRLVNDLFDMTGISLGKVALHSRPIELAVVVNQTVEAARPQYEDAGHDLVITLPADPVMLNGDPIRLAQVVGNLLDNARKFSERGGRVELTAEREGPQVVIRVRDHGIGIAADQLDRVFEMFTQADTSLERGQAGLGIGLTLVKNLVEMHGGTVEAHSAGARQGSEFVVRLPISVEGPPPRLDSTPCASALPAPRRMLIVDDNRDSAESLAKLLQLAGNEIHTAYDGLAAVEAAAALRPEVVVLDIGLPKLNGYEVARRIRALPWGQAMVLVALTGWGQPEDRERSRAAGFNGHMVKPADHVALMRLLANSRLNDLQHGAPE
jgi:PAS domain S-box-containing protein